MLDLLEEALASGLNEVEEAFDKCWLLSWEGKEEVASAVASHYRSCDL